MTGISQPIVFVTGPQDAGKTEFARFALSIVDPVTIPERGGALPTKEEDWKSRVSAYRCVLIDNASHITAQQSDTLCKVTTGGEATTRTLYTNDTAHISDIQVPVWLTSIGVGALRNDLQSRMVRVELHGLTPTNRRVLSDLREAQRQSLPGILRALLELTAKVIALLPVIDRTGVEHRLTDFAVVVRCLDKVLGTSAADRLLAVAADLAEDVLDADPVALALLHALEFPTIVPGPVLGDHTPTELHRRLRTHAAMLHLDGPT